MKHTQWRDNFRRVVAGRAVAYHRTGAGYEQDMPFEDVVGHGGFLTTVGGLPIWNEALPHEHNLLGLGFFPQGFTLVANANPPGALATNALEVMVGR